MVGCCGDRARDQPDRARLFGMVRLSSRIIAAVEKKHLEGTAVQRRSAPMSFLRREDALNLPNVIEVVAGEHPDDVLHRLFATLGMDSMVLPLFRRD